MYTRLKILKPLRAAQRIVITGALVAVLVALMAAAQEPSGPAAAGPAKQMRFPTPEHAVDALLAAFKNNDEKALLDIFGHEHEKLVVVTDKVARGEALKELWQAAQEMRELRPEGDDENTRILVLGKHDWPFPIPLVKEPSGWRFDTAAGEDEILNRRIGAGELGAIAVCHAYVDAQIEYASQDHDGDEVHEYAQQLGSSEGKRNGLYWEVDPTSGEELSPFGPLVAEASAFLAARKKAKAPIPYNGYYYKVLTRQGENPPGGEYDYIINGNMIAGFALLAYPADYGSSGVLTFVVSHQGKVFGKDLGPKTHEIAEALTEYDPDKTWRMEDLASVIGDAQEAP